MILQPKTLVYAIESDVVRVGNVELNKEAPVPEAGGVK